MILQRFVLDPINGVCILIGDGAPTGLDAPQGSLYIRRDGGSGTTLYTKYGTTTSDWSALS
jgi:hypothetical protein